jgi:hypothetical protein
MLRIVKTIEQCLSGNPFFLIAFLPQPAYAALQTERVTCWNPGFAGPLLLTSERSPALSVDYPAGRCFRVSKKEWRDRFAGASRVIPTEKL